MVLAVCILLVTSGFVGVYGDTYKVQVGGLNHNTDERFMSYTLDTENIRNNWVHENMKSEKFLALSKLLAPAYFRVGGTTEDKIIFQENPGGDVEVPDDYDYFILSGEDFVNINEYAKNAGAQLIYGLNAQIRDGSDWNPLNSPFNNTNARELIRFAVDREYNIIWQFGNEPDLYSGNYKTTGARIAKDFITLRAILDTFPYYTQLIGPDVAGVDDFLQDFVNNAKGAVNAFTWHQYYENGATAQLTDFVKADVLNKLGDSITRVQTIMKKANSVYPIWLSETSSAYGGGAKNISDRFVAGFAWLDKLGMAAIRGVLVVCRQAIVGGNYGLLTSELDPNPDYWLSVLFKRLVGPEVLDVPVPDGDVRMYAHCVSSRAEQPAGAVVLYGSNLANEETQLDVSTIVGSGGATKVLAYVLTGETGLDSKTVLLNNNRLELGGDDSIPELNPVEIDSDSITLPPQSLVFYVFPDVKHADC